MLIATVLLPLLFAALALIVHSDRGRPLLLPVLGVVHLGCSILAVAGGEPAAGGWLALDPPARLVLLVVSALFLACSVYAVSYLRWFEQRKNRVFCASLCAFLGMTSLVAAAQHLGLMWVAIESTTLSSAPLLYYNRTPRSLEALWKYLLVGSVGIALALLGSLFLGYASLASGHESTLLFDDLLANAGGFSKPWLHAAFVLLLVGYGTKMGVAPMHTWKPDAYGEAPGLVGALLAGALASAAFLAVLRIWHVLAAAGESAFASRILIAMGLLSIGIAAAFLVRQRDFKRMLAYSSVEHVGILLLGIGIGGAGTFGALLHVVNNALVKGVLFLTAGNLHRTFESKSSDVAHGALRRAPWSGGLFVAGFFAAAAAPPFATFTSEFTVVRAAFDGGRHGVAAILLVSLFVAFAGMAGTVFTVALGEPEPSAKAPRYRDGFLTIAPPALLLLLALAFGIHLPAPLRALVRDAAAYLGSSP